MYMRSRIIRTQLPKDYASIKKAEFKPFIVTLIFPVLGHKYRNKTDIKSAHIKRTYHNDISFL